MKISQNKIAISAFALLLTTSCSTRFGVADAETEGDVTVVEDPWDPGYSNSSLDNGGTHILGEDRAQLDTAESMEPDANRTGSDGIPAGSGALYRGEAAELEYNDDIPLFPGEDHSINAASLTDADFISRIHNANLKSVEMGRMAAERADSPWVRAYGRRVAMDQSFADRRLSRIAHDGNVEIAALSGDATSSTATGKAVAGADGAGYNLIDNADIQHLRTLNGSAFDDAYLRMVQADHDEKIPMLEAAKAQLPADSSLRKLIVRFLPIMEQHRALADSVMNKRLETAQL